MRLIIAIALLVPVPGWADTMTVDFVKVLNGNTEEALFYYEQNWKQHRVEAARRGFISSYQMLVRTSDEGGTDILLITGYATDEQYEKREENFAIVMNRSEGGGPRLLNDKSPGEFREVIDGANYTNAPSD